MVKNGTKNVRSLLKHQRLIELSLRDFLRGRNTSHLPEAEIDLIILALEKRLEGIKAILASERDKH